MITCPTSTPSCLSAHGFCPDAAARAWQLPSCRTAAATWPLALLLRRGEGRGARVVGLLSIPRALRHHHQAGVLKDALDFFSGATSLIDDRHNFASAMRPRQSGTHQRVYGMLALASKSTVVRPWAINLIRAHWPPFLPDRTACDQAGCWYRFSPHTFTTSSRCACHPRQAAFSTTPEALLPISCQCCVLLHCAPSKQAEFSGINASHACVSTHSCVSLCCTVPPYHKAPLQLRRCQQA